MFVFKNYANTCIIEFIFVMLRSTIVTTKRIYSELQKKVEGEISPNHNLQFLFHLFSLQMYENYQQCAEELQFNGLCEV